jgi:hypothetical protein
VTEVKALHRQAMAQTDLALEAQRKGEPAQALAYFRQAYDLEAKAATLLAGDLEAEPTRSVLLRSAASLAMDCNLIAEAEKLICTALIGHPTAEIAEELRDLLEQVHFQRHLALRGVTLSDDEVQMSIAGNGVGYGIAPTNAFLERVENTETLLYRTAERTQRKPYRERGRRDKTLEENLELYMTEGRAASFAVTFRVGRGEQLSLPGTSIAEQVIDELLECLELFTRGDDAQLKDRIREDAYYRNFLGLARNIAPDGKAVNLVGFTTYRRGQVKRVALTARVDDLGTVAQPSVSLMEPTKASPRDGLVEVAGMLKLADSRTKGRDEIEIVDAGNVRHRIIVPLGMMSDIVKPLWDTPVVVTGIQKGKKILLEEIHPLTTKEPGSPAPKKPGGQST